MKKETGKYVQNIEPTSTFAFSKQEGTWELMLDGEIVKAIWNSKGAAEAAIPVERKRRLAKKGVSYAS